MQEWTSEHWSDDNGNPAGGVSNGVGFCVSWQNGPLGRGDERRKPNGAFVETMLEVVKDRLEYYQKSKFACQRNADAITAIDAALSFLRARTADREARDVEGTHKQ